ncbi:MAG: methyltransferase domain-containing protein [Pseudoflavonifractor sp.]
MKSLFCCPLCGAALTRDEKTYFCPGGHAYDRAKEGYVHLLPPNHIHSKAPGDDKDMAAARNRFLSAGGYDHLRDLLCTLALAYTGQNPRVLDSGCGEGYYTAGIAAALTQAGRNPMVAGVDLSKPSLRYAAKRSKDAEFAVASVYHLPVADGSADLLVNCFSPLALEEFQRVLRPGGVFLYVVPGANHLLELKQVLYEKPYPNPEEDSPYPGFTYAEIRATEGQMDLPGGLAQDLFRMTPYYWKTPKEGKERLAALDHLSVRGSFRVHVFRKND